jgi:hypothetical protein
MTRKMSYTKLMKLVDDGDAEITAWAMDDGPAAAQVTFFKSNGTSKRETVEVTGMLKSS